MRLALAGAPAPDCAHGFPRAWWRHLGARGLLGIGFSQDGGPPVADAVQVSALAGIVAHETASLGLGMAWMMQQMLGRFVLAPHLRSDRQRALLVSMARGDALLALAISEPGVGAHPKHLSCRAVPDGDGWLLDGHKAFVSNGPAADAIIVLAVSGEHAGRKRFDAFVVEVNTPGLIREGDDKMRGLAPLDHCGLRLADCRVPDSQRLGAPGQAFDTIARPLRAIEDALLPGPMLGAMQAELDALARSFPTTARTPDAVRDLGALQLELTALRAVRNHVARHLDQHGCDDTLALLTVGTRRLLDRWQNACEAFSALHACASDRPALAGDLRLVLGIARGIAESRQLQAGETLLKSTTSHENTTPSPL
jgi:acyl-CoA dehydrogenase